jgi:hypothetical protein
MRELFLLVGLYAVFKIYKRAREFFKHYELLVFSKEDLEDLKVSTDQMDLRGTPTHMCVCGSEIFDLKVVFDNYEISTYFLDMECANCGNLATAPTPLDREKME